MKTLRKELPSIVIVLAPFIYLAYLWNTLPDRVPVHWNIEGKVDRYGSKLELVLIPILLPLLIYLLLLVIPKIDPKKKIANMGVKYQNLKLILVAFMSFLAIQIMYASGHPSSMQSNFIFLIIGVLFAVLGNYFKTIKANYFIGIRTPWTLESEEVWKKTHALGGKLWLAGGVLIVLFSLVLNNTANLIVFLSITGVLVIVPVVYSYLAFQKIGKSRDAGGKQ